MPAVIGAAAWEDTAGAALSLSACARGRRWAEALATLRRLGASEKGPRLDTVAFNVAMSAAVTGDSESWRHALQLWAQLRRTPGLRRSAVTCGSAVHACSKGQAWPKAVALLRAAEVQGLELSLVAYNCGIAAWKRGQRWGSAVEILREVRRVQLQPSAATQNSAMSACEVCHQWEQVLILWKDQQMWHQQSAVGCATALRACVEGGHLDAALGLLAAAGHHRCLR
ncbi:unnamed protein product [Polarella glacialis]|uniref:Pentatricopeptide repeat-containing protein, chloroplastic n=1 Tax=Polarella glacialis TaxID=89957 RepID=A0A813LK19_POLGL|nr:unnamed protein product [Polarella glacialis]